MNKLKEKLNSKKYDDQLYGDLLATKVRRLSSSSKLHAKYEIYNIMFKYMLQNEEDQQANIQASARDQFTSPPSTPSSPIQANSPVYHQSYQQPSYQQQAIPSRQFLNINCFQTQQESNGNQTQLLQACLITISHQTRSCLLTYLRDQEKTINPKFLYSYIFLLSIIQFFFSKTNRFCVPLYYEFSLANISPLLLT